MKPKTLTSVIVFIATTCLYSTVWAGPFDLYGAGQRGMAMGAQTAKGDSGFALAYNPALLSSSKVGMRIGGFASFNSTQIVSSDRPQGYDLVDRELEYRRTDSDRGDPLYGVMMALNFETFVDGLNFGAAIFLPTNELIKLNTNFPDERQAQTSGQLSFELIGNRVHRPDIQLGASYKITDWFHFGVGGMLVPGATLMTNVYLDDPANQEDVDLNATGSTTSSWGVMVGALFLIGDTLTAGLSFRSDIGFAVKGENQIKIRDVDEDGETRQTIDWLPLYSPAQGRAGISWDAGSVTWAFDWTYTFWSNYRNTHNESTEFHDTISGHLGLEYDYSENSKVRAGLGFEPTAVPAQIDRTNYVDNHRVIARLGSAHTLDFGGEDYELSWSAQAHFLVPRGTVKRLLEDAPNCDGNTSLLCDEQPDVVRDLVTGEEIPGEPGFQTSNPGFPGFSSGGWFAGISAEVAF